MTEIDRCIADRRSIRKYREQPVEKEKLEQVLEAARLAPSACNAQPWRFAVVTDRALNKRIIDEGMGLTVPNTWGHSAPVIIVVCSEKSLFTHQLAERVGGVQFHLIDIGIACEHLVLKAHELGLGTCYIGWFKEKNIKKIISLSSSWGIECLVTLGYPDSIPEATPRKKLADIVKYIHAAEAK
jgi:nitroreductase